MITTVSEIGALSARTDIHIPKTRIASKRVVYKATGGSILARSRGRFAQSNV
jgi:hypothetical protein